MIELIAKIDPNASAASIFVIKESRNITVRQIRVPTYDVEDNQIENKYRTEYICENCHLFTCNHIQFVKEFSNKT